jgi:hypothetical protein
MAERKSNQEVERKYGNCMAILGETFQMRAGIGESIEVVLVA